MITNPPFETRMVGLSASFLSNVRLPYPEGINNGLVKYWAENGACGNDEPFKASCSEKTGSFPSSCT